MVISPEKTVNQGDVIQMTGERVYIGASSQRKLL